MTLTPEQETLLRRVRWSRDYRCSQEETLHASRLVAAGLLTWHHEGARWLDITEAGRAALLAISGSSIISVAIPADNRLRGSSPPLVQPEPIENSPTEG
jgi:hypothetical protein